jgi:hypothetical protein
MEYTKVSKNKWEKIIQQSDNAYLFHSPIWAKIIEKTYDYHTATRQYNINDKEILIPIMEKNNYGFKTFDSMPHGYGGIFSESDITTNDIKAIINDIIGGRNLSFHLMLPPFMNLSTNDSNTPIKEEWKMRDEWNYAHLLNLEGKNFEDIWKNYKRKTRQHIRKAKKSGIETRGGTSLDDYRTFYNIYSKVSSQKWGYENPEYPFDFFHNLYKYGSPHVKLSLATKDNQTIAGLITFPYAKTVYYWGSAFKAEYGNLNPTSLLFNESIKQECQENYKYINFGGSGKLKGVRRFKEGLGAGKVEINKYKVLSNLGKIIFFLNKGS